MEPRLIMPDGSVAPVSWSRVQRFTVRHVTSTDHPHSGKNDRWDVGTFATVKTRKASHRELLILLAGKTEAYQTPPVVSGVGFGPRDASGRRLAFRWSWERLTTWSGRVSDTMIVTVDSWS